MSTVDFFHLVLGLWLTGLDRTHLVFTTLDEIVKIVFGDAGTR